MYFFNNRYPLGLPPGTVRAVLILSLTFTVVVILLKYAAYHEDIPQEMAKFMTGAITAIVLLIKDYINQRGDDTMKDLKNEIDRLTKGGDHADPPAQ